MSQQESCNVATSNVTNKLHCLFMSDVKKIRRELGDLVRSSRQELKLSQDGLAKLIDMDRQSVYRIENAITGTTKETGLKLSKHLGIDKNRILALIAGMEDQPPKDSDRLRIWREVDKLPPDRKAIAIKQMDAIVDALKAIPEDKFDYDYVDDED